MQYLFSSLQSVTVEGEFDPAPPDAPIHINAVGCSGQERALSECSYDFVTGATNLLPAGVKCAGNCISSDKGNIVDDPYKTFIPHWKLTGGI